jgi:hypothetical protein
MFIELFSNPTLKLRWKARGLSATWRSMYMPSSAMQAFPIRSR